MFLRFPDLKTFQLALTNGCVPASASQTRAKGGSDAEGHIWIETSASLSRATMAQLKKLGVPSLRRGEAKLMAELCCWHQLLPLAADPASTAHLEQTPVLFVLGSGQQLAGLVSEILRLGNDRQTYRWLEDKDETSGQGLLRVVGPPYYSLLRALDRHGSGLSPVAFVERAPRVWVELGFTHPLVAHIKPAAGQMLLLRPPRHWQVLEDAPFRDVYEVMEFNLPSLPVACTEGELGQKIRVNLSLRSNGAAEGGELWVLRDEPVETLNRFVQNADDQLLHRLAFAVGSHDGRATIVLRARHSKSPPPIVVLPGALAFRPFLKLPNLFLPCGKGLHPPLRRDQVRKLLASDPAQVTWLLPAGETGFSPQSLPENAFRPLDDWVDYVLDQERVALEAWMQAARFDFEPFICDEEPQSKPRKAAGPDRPRGGKAGSKQEGSSGEAVAFTARVRKDKGADDDTMAEDAVEVVQTDAAVQALREEQRQLEEQFLALEGGLDVPERQALWPKLAAVAGRLGNSDDAGICWGNALWSLESPPAEWSWRWFCTEAMGVKDGTDIGRPRGKTWATRLAGARQRDIGGDDMDRLLDLKEPGLADLRALAALLVWATTREPFPQAVLDRLNALQRFLEAHEKLLPVRAVWLAWLSLVRMSQGDVLALARARDRLLERLFHNGLRPEQELPGFLRFGGQPATQRFRGVRQWLIRLCEMAKEWVRKQEGETSTIPMAGYVDLIFAFGLARLGETDASREALARAATVLNKQNDFHKCLFKAYEYRIKQALDGKPHAGPLPPELVGFREVILDPEDPKKDLNLLPRYAIDRLREYSRILEPNLKIDAFRLGRNRAEDLERELAELPDVTERQEVITRVQRLLQQVPATRDNVEPRARILKEVLPLAPRINENFAKNLLDQVLPTFDAMAKAADASELLEQAKLLERSLFVAAHFDQGEYIRPLVQRFQGLLEAQKGKEGISALDSLAGQCFRGLRKLGMRDEIDQLLNFLAHGILQGRELHRIDAKNEPQWPASLRALLHVAAGWFYFSRDREADPVLEAARSFLFRGDMTAKEKMGLACTYAATLGQAPVEAAKKSLEEIFVKLKLSDDWSTKPYFCFTQLNVIETVVLAVASDDFTLGADARRWLDDDEFLVRRRIHRDLRSLLGQH